jgi:hypothetical protein
LALLTVIAVDDGTVGARVQSRALAAAIRDKLSPPLAAPGIVAVEPLTVRTRRWYALGASILDLAERAAVWTPWARGARRAMAARLPASWRFAITGGGSGGGGGGGRDNVGPAAAVDGQAALSSAKDAVEAGVRVVVVVCGSRARFAPELFFLPPQSGSLIQTPYVVFVGSQGALGLERGLYTHIVAPWHTVRSHAHLMPGLLRDGPVQLETCCSADPDCCRPVVIVSRGSVHRFGTPAAAARSRGSPAATSGHVVFVVGGNAVGFRLTERILHAAAQECAAVCAENAPATRMISVVLGPRTPRGPAVADVLTATLRRSALHPSALRPAQHVASVVVQVLPRDVDFGVVLASAATVVVTADSVNMVTEACAVCADVRIALRDHVRARHRRAAELFCSAGLARWCPRINDAQGAAAAAADTGTGHGHHAAGRDDTGAGNSPSCKNTCSYTTPLRGDTDAIAALVVARRF